MLKVAMLSGWHVHAKDYEMALAAIPDVKITAVWDEDAVRGKAWAERLKVPFEHALDAVLKRADVDAVCVCTPTNRHPEVMIAAAKMGKHIFTEKAMALTVDDCDRIAKAVREANVRFCISLPYRGNSEVLYAKKIVEEGLLGSLTSIRVRVSHNGAIAGWLPPHFWDPATCGGGAMIDLGAHPMYLTRWLAGQPKRISSIFTHVTKRPVDDNAVSIIEFENGCIGISETSFVSAHYPYSLEITGTEGSFLVGGPERTVRIRSNKIAGDKWITVNPAELPKALPNTVQIWVDGILRGTPIPYGLEEGTQLTELMQYAYLAANEKREVEIPARTKKS